MDKKYKRLMSEVPKLFTNLPNGIEILTDTVDIERIEREYGISVGIVYEDEYLMLIKDAVRFTDGVEGPYIRAYHKNSGGASVLVLYGDKILLLKHFRHSLRNWLWETPRGFGESGQNSEENALRELEEELGLVVMEIYPLGLLYPDAGIIGEAVALYCVHVSPDTPIVTDNHEGISSVGLFTKEELYAAIISGEINDGITIASLTYAQLKGLI